MNLVKTEPDAVECVAHELAHIRRGTEDHGVGFQDEWAQLLAELTRLMEDGA